MRLCRFLRDQLPEIGVLLDDGTILPVPAMFHLAGSMATHVSDILDLLPGGASHALAQRALQAASPQAGSEAIPVDSVQLLTPLPSPGKMLFLAGNYADHVVEQGGKAEERARTFPYVFLKPLNTLTHPNGPIRIPACSPNKIDWEVELGVIIGRECRNVSEADALGYVAGYTVINDVSDRGFRPNPERNTRPKDTFFDWQHGKWHDTFCPMGPCILSASACPDPQQLKLGLRVKGHDEQDGSTSSMIFPVAAVVSFLSQFMTLLPGDVISTGTPDGVGNAKGKFLKPGDMVEAWIEGIGTLRNPVV